LESTQFDPAGLEASLALMPPATRTLVAEKISPLVEAKAAILSHSLSHTEQVLKAVAVSDFLAGIILRYPDMVADWLLSERFTRTGHMTKATLQDDLNELLKPVHSSEALAKVLREFRRQHMFAIVFRDLVLQESFEVTAREVSWLAEVCIDAALDWHEQALSRQYGYALDSEGNKQRMVILGMGKLGAEELNVSSDIDLIFAYHQSGATAGGRRSLDNQSYFVRLGQKLIQSLDTVTADGFVFRVDMRLRPYGESGALALSFAAMEEYYADQGRDWERYALIKAAAVAGDIEQGQQLLASLHPFVYRKYIDYGAIESLRVMKEMIVKDVRRKGMQQNIKVGDGGIREVEFIAQVFQLMRGGRVPDLQQRSLLAVLTVLQREQLLPAAAVSELRQAYLFLRNLEHAIQGLQDKQTQLIPDDDLSRSRIALATGYADWNSCEDQLNHYRSRVSAHFADLISDTPEEKAEAESKPLWRQLWLSQIDRDQLAVLFPGCESTEVESALQQLQAFRSDARIIRLQAQGRERLDQFMPLLLEYFAQQRGTGETFSRLLGFVESVARRSAYLAMLNENEEALRELITLFAASRWVAEQIIATPMLLDELLHSSLYSPPDLATLQDELRQQMLQVPEDDLETQMETLRYFKKAHVLRVAASELRGTLPLMKVSDYLTFIAETILNQVFEQAWTALVGRYGVPVNKDGSLCDRDFGIVGYGKLGGIELSYGSDLDLVFLHDCQAIGETNGEKSLDNQVFFTRLGQKIIHLLTAKTVSGDIYEVDMRLRPSGNSGLLVSSVNSFYQYQMENAWTWEHQALVRARFICGSPLIKQRFMATRKQILTAPRDPQILRKDVLAMRQKMQETLAARPNRAAKANEFDLKQDAGGIVDIEFMVQYAALRWASAHPAVVEWSDNIRLLESLSARSLIAAEDAKELCEIYRIFRSRGHLLALQKLPGKVTGSEFVAERERVKAVWRRLFDV